jgi:predicted dehydrogenase
LKILIIGLGSIAKKHINAILTLYKDVEIFAFRFSSRENIEGVNNVYSLENLVNKLDFVIISNPTFLHGETILNCLHLNCPIFLEKPPLNNFINANKINQLLINSKTVNYVAFNLRFHPVIEYLKNNDELKKQKINEINVYCGSYLPNWRPNSNFKEIYSVDKAMGGGVHLDLIHEIDYCIWIFGKPMSVQSIKKSNSNLEINAIDYAQFNFFYENFVLNIKLNYFRLDSKREIEILTENDTIICDLNSCIIKSAVTDKIIFKKNYNIMDTYILQMKYFVDAIKNGKKILNNFEESLEVLKIALNDEFK